MIMVFLVLYVLIEIGKLFGFYVLVGIFVI